MSNGKKLTKRRIKKKNNDCFWMENIFCLESHIHLCSRHTSAIPAYVIKTCVTWHAISGTRYWGFVSPKLHVSTYRNQQHCWWFHYCNSRRQTVTCVTMEIACQNRRFYRNDSLWYSILFNPRRIPPHAVRQLARVSLSNIPPNRDPSLKHTMRVRQSRIIALTV